MQDGIIRISRIKDTYHDFSDYFILPMHDNARGTITGLTFSYDKKYLFSIGTDGNIFSYTWNPPPSEIEPDKIIELSPEEVNDIDDPRFLSLEQQKNKDDYDRRYKIAQEKKRKVLNILEEHRKEFKIAQNK